MINQHDENYHDMLSHILTDGVESSDRTGTGTISLFGLSKTYDISETFPLITTRKINFDSTVDELLWFLSGSTNVNDLPERTKKWWTPWVSEDGSLGKIYGHQWRHLPSGDQLLKLIKGLKTNPDSRRHLVVLYNPNDLDEMNLPCCHGSVIQFYLKEGKLSCQMYQRSGDMLLGVPVNIASYSLLTYMIAQVIGAKPDKFHHVIGDAHIYLNHLDPVKSILRRESFSAPKVILNKDILSIDDFKNSDIILEDYNSHPGFKVKVAV